MYRAVVVNIDFSQSSTDLAAFSTVYFRHWDDYLDGLAHHREVVRHESLYPSVRFRHWMESAISGTAVASIYKYFDVRIGTNESQESYAGTVPDIWAYMEGIKDKIRCPGQPDFYLERNFVNMCITG